MRKVEKTYRCYLYGEKLLNSGKVSFNKKFLPRFMELCKRWKFGVDVWYFGRRVKVTLNEISYGSI